MTPIEAYYNKFNEDKRLTSRHGQVEYRVTMHYIETFLGQIDKPREQVRILDIGAATGAYSIPLAECGYDVSAVEPVKHNISRLRKKSSLVHAIQANALELGAFGDAEFDLTLLFGPMYHLKSEEELEAALSEAKRVTRPGGYLFVAYVMNEYCILTHGFRDHHILQAMQSREVDESFACTEKANPLYHIARKEEIDKLNHKLNLQRLLLFAPDGPANYMRRELNAMDEAEFEAFIAYQLATCEREDLIGASAHTVDILTY